MPRKPRLIESGFVYHVFNRRTDRQCLFPSAQTFDAFIDLMEEGRQRYKVHHFAYCLMATHWHFAVSATEATAVANYLRWLATIHAIRFRVQSGTRGNGHVYQDRYKSLRVDGPFHYLTLVRYIEANPLTAGLVERAEEWRWSSLSDRVSGRRRLVEDGPWALPACWPVIVNTSQTLLSLTKYVSLQAAVIASARAVPNLNNALSCPLVTTDHA